jgi:type I restriction enzyme M protein
MVENLVRSPDDKSPRVLTGDIKNQIDRVWDAFWSGGISNPLEVMEQITYLLFLRRLDDLQTLEENKANTLKKPIERALFPKGKDKGSTSYADMRWSRFMHKPPAEMYEIVGEHVFPFLRSLGGEGST